MWNKNAVAMPSLTNSTSPGQHGGIISKSTLQLEVTPDLHKSVFSCQASNDIGGQHIHDAITLEVFCKSYFVITDFLGFLYFSY